MTRVLEDDVIRNADHRQHGGPWARVSGRVVDGELVVDLAGRDACEAFDCAQGLRGDRESERCVRAVIGGFYHERVVLPMSDRIAIPLAQSAPQMWPSVHWDAADVVDVLVENCHVPR